jgi:hypothetical protein
MLPLIEVSVQTTEADEDVVDCESRGGCVCDLEDCQSARIGKLHRRDVHILLP